MGQIREPRPALLVMAQFSRYESALEWSRIRAAQAWGPLALTSDLFDFDETPYYEKTMGPALKKQLLAFECLIDPGRLAAIKLETNRWEQDYTGENEWPEPRPLNLDPGYITEAKLVLATTKDRDHRMYLGDGIFAEVTLFYHSGRGAIGLGRILIISEVNITTSFRDVVNSFVRSCAQRRIRDND